jgi:hypothetical protein
MFVSAMLLAMLVLIIFLCISNTLFALAARTKTKHKPSGSQAKE